MTAKPPMLSDASCDLLIGRAMIGRWLGLSRGACDAAIVNRTVVTFRWPRGARPEI
jgi:hypothetical protein